LIDTGNQNNKSGVLIPEGNGGQTALRRRRSQYQFILVYSYRRASTSACPERYRLKPKPYSEYSDTHNVNGSKKNILVYYNSSLQTNTNIWNYIS